MKTFRFLDFKVCKDSKNFYRMIVSVTNGFPNEHRDLVNQLIRATLSVCLNIAEGSAKKSDKDFNRYIENSLGSISESVSAMDIAHDNNLINSNVFNELIISAEGIAKQLGGLSKKLKS